MDKDGEVGGGVGGGVEYEDARTEGGGGHGEVGRDSDVGRITRGTALLLSHYKLFWHGKRFMRDLRETYERLTRGLFSTFL